jgi:hypothetical protein
VSENKILERLKRLYQLAILRPEEEENEARQNEARTSAFLLIKIARENGVRLKFEVPGQTPQTSSAPRSSVPRGVPDDIKSTVDFFDELLRNFARSRGGGESPFRAPPPRGRRPPSAGWPDPPSSSFGGPARSPHSKFGSEIIEVRVNGDRVCDVCGNRIRAGRSAWMMQGFHIGATRSGPGFAHKTGDLDLGPFGCGGDYGLREMFDENVRRRQASADDAQVRMRYAQEAQDFVPPEIRFNESGYPGISDEDVDAWRAGGISDEEMRKRVQEQVQERAPGRKRAKP